MKSSIAALILMASLVPVLSVSPFAQDPPAKPFVMGFVDMERLIQEHREFQTRVEGLKREFEERQSAFLLQIKELQSLQENLDVPVPGSQLYLTQLKRIKTLEATLELDRKLLNIESQLKIVEVMKDIYGRCRAVVGEVARERGYSCVSIVSNREVDGPTQRELEGDIQKRSIVYYEDAFDITEEVLKRIK
jgi:Skp family chaperone for outer membrane proteins